MDNTATEKHQPECGRHGGVIFDEMTIQQDLHDLYPLHVMAHVACGMTCYKYFIICGLRIAVTYRFFSSNTIKVCNNYVLIEKFYSW